MIFELDQLKAYINTDNWGVIIFAEREINQRTKHLDIRLKISVLENPNYTKMKICQNRSVERWKTVHFHQFERKGGIDHVQNCSKKNK